MKKSECREAAYRFITAYNWLDQVGDKMKVAELFGVHLGYLNETLDLVSQQMGNLVKDGHLTTERLTELRVLAQDVRRHMPAVPKEFLEPGQGKRLSQSIYDNQKLMDKLAEVMFESVAECECRR